MAEIPVERKEKKSFPWWMLIPLLLLLLLIPYVCSRSAVVDNTNSYNANRTVVTTTGANNSAGRANASTSGTTGDGAVVTNANNGASSTVNTGSGMTNGGSAGNSGAAVTDVNLFGTATDKATLVGRNVNLSGVRVNRVLSDKVFTVKSGSGEMFVMLDNNLDSAGGKEQQIKMKPGQNVNLGGAFRSVPTGEVKEETKEGGLNKNEYAQMKGQNVYLHATSVSDVK